MLCFMGYQPLWVIYCQILFEEKRKRNKKKNGERFCRKWIKTISSIKQCSKKKKKKKQIEFLIVLTEVRK